MIYWIINSFLYMNSCNIPELTILLLNSIPATTKGVTPAAKILTKFKALKVIKHLYKM